LPEDEEEIGRAHGELAHAIPRDVGHGLGVQELAVGHVGLRGLRARRRAGRGAGARRVDALRARRVRLRVGREAAVRAAVVRGVAGSSSRARRVVVAAEPEERAASRQAGEGENAEHLPLDPHRERLAR
jgi:hypothetical protein